MLELSIEQTAFCALIGFLLSVVITMAVSRRARLGPQSILTRLVLAAAPVYLGVDYLLDQDLLMVIVAAGCGGIGLYCFREWWLSQPAPVAAEPHRAVVASDQSVVLRYRVEAVVRADRRKTETGVRADRRYAFGSAAEHPAKAA
jgi:hypothetical protein